MDHTDICNYLYITSRLAIQDGHESKSTFSKIQQDPYKICSYSRNKTPEAKFRPPSSSDLTVQMLMKRRPDSKPSETTTQQDDRSYVEERSEKSQLACHRQQGKLHSLFQVRQTRLDDSSLSVAHADTDMSVNDESVVQNPLASSVHRLSYFNYQHTCSRMKRQNANLQQKVLTSESIDTTLNEDSGFFDEFRNSENLVSTLKERYQFIAPIQ